jgi:hypothetical protein
MKGNRQILRDIETLARLLKKYQIESDNLYLLEQMASNHKLLKECSLNDLTFTFSCAAQKPYPDVVKKIAVVIDLNYSYGDLDTACDVFQTYQLELCIKGYERNKETESKYFCWHLDRETNLEGKFIHPRYHFHAGGYRMKDVLEEEGRDFVISSPRLAHPPMDVILIVHFIIQNFINKRDQANMYKITNDEEYIAILMRAQNRVLDPYFATFSKDSNHQDYTKNNLFPLYS